MGKITRQRRSKKSPPPRNGGGGKPPTHCRDCGKELRVALQSGRYTIMRCDNCKLCYRHFPPDPLEVFLDEEDEHSEDDQTRMTTRPRQEGICVDSI